VRARLNWEIAVYIILFIVALAIRLWALDARVFSFDEFENVWWGGAWSLYHNHIYHHTPVTHGPFQGYSTALAFFLFGDSDFTARLAPALFGTALVALPYFLRRQLGRWGALIVAVLLTFSPTFLFFSRYARNDIYIVFWALLLVVCLWRYFEGRKARYLYIGAASLSLSFCTKEATYFTVAIFILFLFIVSAKELVNRARRRFDLKDLPAPAEFLLLIGTLSLPLFSAAVQLIPKVDFPAGFHWGEALIVVLLFIISAAIGIRWNWRRWLISFLIFYGIFVLLYTTFFTNIYGFASGIWGSLDYWIGQAGRVTQPWYYYIILMPIYEFLPLLFAFVGAIYYAIRGNLFSRFLVWWVLLSLIPYSFYGEKMPQISLYIVLPAILIGGMFIYRLWQAFDWKGARAWAIRGITIIALLLLFPATVYIAFQVSYDNSGEPPQMLVYAGISQDLQPIMAQIEEVAGESGEGKELAITVDGSGGGLSFYWPWAWYLRDYTNVEFPDLSSVSEPPQGSVLLIKAKNKEAAELYLEKYDEGQEFQHLIWFPEEYKDFDLGWWWNYFLHRKTEGPYWTSGTEGIAYFPESIP
jgi:uncharacterized protein (TIGR03663 family)